MLFKRLLPETKALFLLALPLIGSGVIENSLGFFSILFLARVSQETLAAGALGTWMFATLMVIMWGTLSAIATLVSHRHGANDVKGVARVLRDSLWFVLLATLPCMLLIWNLDSILLRIGQDPQMIALAKPYFHAMVWAIFPDFMFTVFLFFVMGLGHMRTNLVFTLFWVSLNIFLNYCLIFGKFGLPALGIVGAGYGMAISFWIIASIMALYLLLSKTYRIYFQNMFHNPIPSVLMELLRVGLPMGLMFCIEIGFFTCITLIMGTMNSHAIAANQITMQFLGQFSTVSLCFAQAITVRMGHCLGAKDILVAKRAAYIGMFMACSFMCVVAIIYWLFAEQLVHLDLDPTIVDNATVITMAKQLLAICALVQIFESVRLTAFGALRALKDTRFTLLISIITFWLIAIPVGYWLAMKLHWYGNGLWWGIVISQLIGAGILVWRYQKRIHNIVKHEFNYVV